MSTLALIDSRRILPRHWRLPFALWLSLVAVLLFACRDTVASMVTIWMNSETFAHAFVVPPISLWLVWRKRAELAPLRPRPAPWVAAALASIGFAWLVGNLVSANALAQFALVAMLVASVPLLLGWQVARVLAFPLGFLFFAVPFGEFLTPLMMEQTADFTVAALRASGVPVYREAQRFVIPSGSWSVVEACSGLRYLMATVMVGSLFAYLNYRSMRRRLIFCAVSVVVPIVANWIRAYVIVMLGHLTNNRLAVGADHLIYGWVFFGIVVMLLFWVASHWAQVKVGPTAATTMPMPSASPAAATWALSFLLGAAAIAIPSFTSARLANHVAIGESRVLNLPADLAGGWQAVDADRAEPDWNPVFVNPSAMSSRRYRRGDALIDVRVAMYRQQRPDRKLVSSSNVLLKTDDPHWQTLRTTPFAITSGERRLDAEVLQIAETGSGRNGERRRREVVRLYWVDGRLTTSTFAVSLQNAAQRLIGRTDEAAAIVLSTAPSAGDTGAVRQLADFAATNLDLIASALHPDRLAQARTADTQTRREK